MEAGSSGVAAESDAASPRFPVQGPITLRAFWYDVNCRFAPRWRRFVQQNVQDPELREMLMGIHMPLPPVHINMHNSTCQVKCDPAYMKGVGLPHGEIAEITWAWLGQYGLVTQYMSLLHREQFLQHVINWEEDRRAGRVPGLLCRWREAGAIMVGVSFCPIVNL
jgi:hypothetical protein